MTTPDWWLGKPKAVGACGRAFSLLESARSMVITSQDVSLGWRELAEKPAAREQFEPDRLRSSRVCAVNLQLSSVRTVRDEHQVILADAQDSLQIQAQGCGRVAAVDASQIPHTAVPASEHDLLTG